MSWKSGSLNLPEPSGPHRACYGTALALLHVKTIIHFSSYFVHFYIEWEIFEMKIVHKIQTHFVIKKFWCRIHLWFHLMGGLQAKSMTSQRNRATHKMADMHYYGNVMTTRWRLFYIFNSTVVDWTFFKSCLLWENVGKYCRAGQATDGNTEHAYWLLNNWGCRHTLRISDTYSFSTITTVMRTRFNFTFIRTLTDVSYIDWRFVHFTQDGPDKIFFITLSLNFFWFL